ncbi:MAG: P-loop NTPase fold protein, partial [Candidatus Nanopelagicales bacterium]
MKRRDAFVVEVANTIASRHGTEGESFVFGLSGKWGEGKTHFLGRLQTLLAEKGFEIIDLNPWKYSADRIAFLRSFLVQLLETQSRRSRLATAVSCCREHKWTDARDMAMPRRLMLARLTTDVGRQTIHWLRLAILVLLALGAWAVYSHVLGTAQRAAIAEWKLVVSVVLLPVVVFLARGLVSSQTSSKAAAAVDEFDRLTNLALGICSLKNAAHGGKTRARRVAVFVDDLDRVTASVARDVLDNLRTFFDKPTLSFVVAGDHTVLEANLGRELAPVGGRPAELEQGRLFLKKIFNVYWRLPLPVRSDLESFVDAQLDGSGPDIDEFIPDAADQRRLRDWLLLFSDNNLRLVVRTLDSILFTLRLVRAQIESAADEERPILEKMRSEPMLLGRVLMIQDRCAPLFELLETQASLLLDLDTQVANAKAAA